MDYRAQWSDGDAFESYVVDHLQREWRATFDRCLTKTDQLAYGDTFFGLEIKYDKQFAKTGNLCIEVAEKTHASNARYVEAGILCESCAWLYGIGNELEFFIFSRRTLRAVWDRTLADAQICADRKDHPDPLRTIHARSCSFPAFEHPWKHRRRDGIRTYETPTSRGFLIPRVRVPELAEVCMVLNDRLLALRNT
jgi:hypothetical protein